jgi:hypothetical protein
MQGTEATFDEVSFEGGDGPRRVLQKILPGAAAMALAGAVAVWALHLREAAAPDEGAAPSAALAPLTASKPFADIAIDANLLAELKRGVPAQVASLEAAQPSSSAPFPLPSLEPFTPAPAAGGSESESAPLPPALEGPAIGENAPLPPPRPPEFGAPVRPAPERQVAQPNATIPGAPADNRNFLQRLFGIGQTSAPAGPSRPAVASAPPAAAHYAPAPGSAVASAAPEGRAGRGPLAAFFSSFGHSAPVGGYDQYTAVYDISARTVYLPDGTRLEAHSGLGDRLDDPRYVSERARGPTPPHLYELALREGSFHGVQALRLNPVGEGGLYGRAGLLAHPFMLGPNGDSNGCVSFRDYNAFLRAYEDGEIKRLAVVTQL